MESSHGKKMVIVYGNCHTLVISKMLESSPEFNKGYYILHIKRIQDIKDTSYLYSDFFGKCDVFIHQSIRLGNRYGDEFASLRVIERLKPDCRVISIPNVYHMPICFFPQYHETEEFIKKGTTFFFRDSIIDSHMGNPFNTISSSLKDYFSDKTFNEAHIREAFDKFIAKVRKREVDWDIKVSDYLLNNYQRCKLFYDPNHPTNEFLEYVSIKLLNILLGRPCDYHENLTSDICLDSIEMPICNSVVKALQLNWRDHSIRASYPCTNLAPICMGYRTYVLEYMALSWTLKGTKGIRKFCTKGAFYILLFLSFIRRAVRKSYKILKFYTAFY